MSLTQKICGSQELVAAKLGLAYFSSVLCDRKQDETNIVDIRIHGVVVIIIDPFFRDLNLIALIFKRAY